MSSGVGSVFLFLLSNCYNSSQHLLQPTWVLGYIVTNLMLTHKVFSCRALNRSHLLEIKVGILCKSLRASGAQPKSPVNDLTERVQAYAEQQCGQSISLVDLHLMVTCALLKHTSQLKTDRNY